MKSFHALSSFYFLTASNSISTLICLSSLLLLGCSGELASPAPSKFAKPQIREVIAKLDRTVEAIPIKFKDRKKLTLAHEKTIQHESKTGQIRTEVQLRLMNPCVNEMKFHGYTESSPVYLLQVKSEDGTWKDQAFGWCGTGMRNCYVLKGESSTFSVNSYERHKSIRIGIAYNDGQTVWSGEIEL